MTEVDYHATDALRYEEHWQNFLASQGMCVQCRENATAPHDLLCVECRADVGWQQDPGDETDAA